MFTFMLYQFAFGQKENIPCVKDSILLEYLYTQNSYHFSIPDNFRFHDEKQSFSSTCLSPAVKAKIMSLLKGEPYEFEKELNEEKMKYYGSNSDWAKEEKKWILKGDTIRLAEKLDSLYQPIRAEHLTILKAGEFSRELIELVGLIYFYEAIPFLKDELRTPKRYKDIPTLELIKQTLARLGDIKYFNQYLKTYEKASVSYKEFFFKNPEYINNAKTNYTFYTTELNNKTIVTPLGSESFPDKPIWQWALDRLKFYRYDDNFLHLQKIEFGKILLEMEDNELYTEHVRVGVLEIFNKLKNDILVDHRNK